MSVYLAGKDVDAGGKSVMDGAVLPGPVGANPTVTIEAITLKMLPSLLEGIRSHVTATHFAVAPQDLMPPLNRDLATVADFITNMGDALSLAIRVPLSRP